MIFARFMAIYGHKFKSCFETQDEIRIAKREWALSIRGYPEAQLVAAIDRCKETLAWMPTISEFLKILSELDGGDGVPAVREAYLEACRFADRPSLHHWSHPVVYHAGRETGWFRLRSEEESVVLPVFQYHYDLSARRFRAGEALDTPQPQPLPDKREDTLFRFIAQWSQQQGIPEEQAASLLYYLTKPEGSRTRARLKAKAEEKAAALGIAVPLPEQTGKVVQ